MTPPPETQERTAPIGSFGRIVRHEARVLWTDRTLPLVCLLLALLVGYGLFTGIVQSRERDRVALELTERDAATRQAALELWRRVMAGEETPGPFSNPADPASIGSGLGAQHAILPATPLAPAAFGQSDMLPDYYRVTYQSRVSFMYDSEIENPWNLLTGRFDLAFVLVYLLPLMIFVLGYNLLSAEREQGVLRLLLAQPLSVTRLVLAKVALRAGVLLPVATLLPAAVLLVVRPQLWGAEGLAPLGLWLLLTTAYGAFWFALCVLVNTFNRSSAANALILTGSWVLLVLVAPIVLNLAVSAASPAPSRTELATRTRLATVDGLNRFNEEFSSDYRYTDDPGALLPKDGRLEVAPRLRGFYRISAQVDEGIEPLLEAFDRQLAGQQRLVDRFGILSPAVIAHEGMAGLAGNGARRYLAFKDQVVAHHEAWRGYFLPRVLDSVAIMEADFADMPRWSWREISLGTVATDALARIAQLSAIAAVFVGVALRQLRRFRVV